MELSAARGGIPLTDHSTDQAFLDRARSGDWLVQARSQIPAACIDGRPSQLPFPRSAGGAIGLWVAHYLSSPSPLPLFKITDLLAAAGEPVGDHTGSSATGSGCGAADHLADILDLVTDSAVRNLVTAWGFHAPAIDDLMHQRAQQLVEAEYAGSELVAGVRAAPGSYVPELQGGHRESAAIVNRRPGTTVDTGAVAAWSEDSPEVFVVDTWSFVPSASFFFPDELYLQQRFSAALAAFNAAALLCLVHPGFPAVAIDA